MARQAGRTVTGEHWRHYIRADDYRIDLVGLNRSIVEILRHPRVPGEALEQREFDPFLRSTLPEELAKVDNDEAALSFARRNGLLAYFESEPLVFIFDEARKARLVFALLKALQEAKGNQTDPMLEQTVKNLIGAASYEGVLATFEAESQEPTSERPLTPTWRAQRSRAGYFAPDGYSSALLRSPTPWGVAQLVVADVLNAPVEEPWELAAGQGDSGGGFGGGGLAYEDEGVGVNRWVDAVDGEFVIYRATFPLLRVIHWWFQEELRARRPVRQCQWCKHYFFVYDGRQRYCRRPAGEPGEGEDSLCATAARGKRFRGRRQRPVSASGEPSRRGSEGPSAMAWVDPLGGDSPTRQVNLED